MPLPRLTRARWTRSPLLAVIYLPRTSLRLSRLVDPRGQADDDPGRVTHSWSGPGDLISVAAPCRIPPVAGMAHSSRRPRSDRGPRRPRAVRGVSRPAAGPVTGDVRRTLVAVVAPAMSCRPGRPGPRSYVDARVHVAGAQCRLANGPRPDARPRKTGLRSHWHHQHHTLGAPDQLETP
jgi:hypothetical protein